MLKRLIVGVVIGLVVGGLVAAAVIEGLGLMSFELAGGAVLAYALAAATGVLVGLVAGKPIWARGAQIEAGLKALFGALLGAGLMFALRRWVGVTVDLTALHLARQPDTIGNLPALSLPAIATLLGAFYEIDNTPAPEQDGKGARKASAAGAKNVRVAPERADDAEDDAASPSAKKMKH